MPPFDIVLMGWCWSAKSKITPPDDMKSTPELSLGKGTHLGGGVWSQKTTTWADFRGEKDSKCFFWLLVKGGGDE